MPGTLLVSTTDFGWGSIGKLRLILDELDGVRIVVDEESRTGELAAQVMGGRHTFAAAATARPSAALVINDPRAADRIAGAGVPVIYVDSLPYLWATEHEVPASAAVYCAQRSPMTSLPPTSPLRRMKSVHWVEPIVPRARRRKHTSGGGTVINVGGLHSHLVGGAVDAYLRAVVVPLVRELAAAGRRVDAVTGNLPPWAQEQLSALLPGDAAVGPQSAYAFDSLLRSADALITSPGSTTLLQACALGLPTVLLPPQNLSQVLNAELFGTPGPGVIPWPDSVVARDRVDELRPQGEDAVLAYVYHRIVEGSGEEDVLSRLTKHFRAIARTTAPVDGIAPGVRELGHGGARQVARVIRQALFAPFAPVPAPVPDRAGNTVA